MRIARALPTRATAWASLPSLSVLLALATACGGGGGGFDNAPTVGNPPLAGGQALSFAYFQRCVQPVLRTPQPLGGGSLGTSCAASGCHDNVSGTGGALRLTAGATDVDLADPALTPAQIRASEMYRNFYSAQGESILGAPLASRLLTKPLVQGVLHGGGLVFASADDPGARILRYWISRPQPDEFSASASAMFSPPDILTGACRTE